MIFYGTYFGLDSLGNCFHFASCNKGNDPSFFICRFIFFWVYAPVYITMFQLRVLLFQERTVFIEMLYNLKTLLLPVLSVAMKPEMTSADDCYAKPFKAHGHQSSESRQPSPPPTA